MGRVLQSLDMYALEMSTFEMPSALLTDYLAGEPQIITIEHVVLLCCMTYLVKRPCGFGNVDLAEMMHVSQSKVKKLLQQLEAIGIVSFKQYKNGVGITVKLPYTRKQLNKGKREELANRIRRNTKRPRPNGSSA